MSGSWQSQRRNGLGRLIEGLIEGVLVSLEPGSVQSLRRSEVGVTWEGLEGDHHAGLTLRSGGRSKHYPRGAEIRNTRQISLVSVEELEQIADAMGLPKLLPEWLGANLLVSGIPHLSRLPPGTRLYCSQEAAFVVDAENLPCRGPGEVIQAHYPDLKDLVGAFPRAAMGLRGLVGWVERPGRIAEGDLIWADLPETRDYPV